MSMNGNIFQVRLQMIDGKRCIIISKVKVGLVIRTSKKNYDFMKHAGFREMKPLSKIGIFGR